MRIVNLVVVIILCVYSVSIASDATPCKSDINVTIFYWGSCVGTYSNNGDTYSGHWKNGKRHGTGTFTAANGDSYIGQWKKGRPHGQGTFTWLDGSKYIGNYQNGYFHGKGTYTDMSGRTLTGIWHINKLINQ